MTTLRMMNVEQLRLMELLRSPQVFRKPVLRHEEEEDANPILVRSLSCSYETLFLTMMSADFDTGSMQARRLPPELVKRVLSYLTIKRVKQEHLIATNCSSHDGIHPLHTCLEESEHTWWLSSPGTMPGGQGKQFVQFTLGRRNELRRICSVSIKIPPMPQGPLSVREFCLQAFHIERGWYAITPIFHAQNKTGWQKFTFADADVDEVRLVCLSNQMQQYLSNLRANNPNDQSLMAQLGRFESVGFFSVKFE